MTTEWFDERRRRINPTDLQTVEFPVSRLGRRGYEEGPVRDFLKSVQDEFVHLLNERTNLWQEVQRLRRRIIAGESEGEGQVLFGEADAHVHAVRILSTAQVTADKYVADARDYSSRLTKETRVRRDEIVREAQQHSERLLQDAQAKAREAAVAAMDVPVGSPSAEDQQAMQAELAYLRTYSDVYRSHLRAYTEGILRGIDEWERKEATSLQEAENRLSASARAVDGLVSGRGGGNGRSIGSSSPGSPGRVPGNSPGNASGSGRTGDSGKAYQRH